MQYKMNFISLKSENFYSAAYSKMDSGAEQQNIKCVWTKYEITSGMTP